MKSVGPFIISLVLVLSFSCRNDKQAIVKADLQNVSRGDTASLTAMQYSGGSVVHFEKKYRMGRVRFAVPVRQPGFFLLKLNKNTSLTVVLEPGDKVKITGDPNNFVYTRKITGSEVTARIAALHDSLGHTKYWLRQVEEAFSNLDSTSSQLSMQQDSLVKEYNAIRSKYSRFTRGFILDDLNSLANIPALYQQYSPDDYVLNSLQDMQMFKLVSDSLGKYYPKLPAVTELKSTYESLYSEYQKYRILQQGNAQEVDIPDILLPASNGSDKSLSSLKGKVVLISFWSVNQQSSRDNVVALKNIYKKHKNKGFEIYQVSVNKSIPEWRKALSFEEIPWISVIDTAYPSSKTRMMYNVNEVPMNFLIDAEQKNIVAKNVSPENLDRLLSGMLTN